MAHIIFSVGEGTENPCCTFVLQGGGMSFRPAQSTVFVAVIKAADPARIQSLRRETKRMRCAREGFEEDGQVEERQSSGRHGWSDNIVQGWSCGTSCFVGWRRTNGSKLRSKSAPSPARTRNQTMVRHAV
mmetsp:Transcript_10556/g.21833  ORF Transcript_10556/g.21833 Transcript_10556/m.21833 type:complete len:130 (+) Transcript_10556:312-701(+)